jgi:hypothetical protein
VARDYAYAFSEVRAPFTEEEPPVADVALEQELVNEQRVLVKQGCPTVGFGKAFNRRLEHAVFDWVHEYVDMAI